MLSMHKTHVHAQIHMHGFCLFGCLWKPQCVKAATWLSPGFNCFHQKFPSTTLDFVSWCLASSSYCFHVDLGWWHQVRSCGRSSNTHLSVSYRRGGLSLVGNSVLQEEMACVTIRLNRETFMLRLPAALIKGNVCLGRRSSDGISNQTGYISHHVETCLELQSTSCDR